VPPIFSEGAGLYPSLMSTWPHPNFQHELTECHWRFWVLVGARSPIQAVSDWEFSRVFSGMLLTDLVYFISLPPSPWSRSQWKHDPLPPTAPAYFTQSRRPEKSGPCPKAQRRLSPTANRVYRPYHCISPMTVYFPNYPRGKMPLRRGVSSRPDLF